MVLSVWQIFLTVLNNYANLVKLCNFDATFLVGLLKYVLPVQFSILQTCLNQFRFTLPGNSKRLSPLFLYESHSIIEPHANASLTQESQLTEAGQEPSRWSCLSQKKMKTDDYASQPHRARGDDLSQL